MGSCCTKVSDTEQDTTPGTLPPFSVVTTNPVVTESTSHTEVEESTQHTKKSKEVRAPKTSKTEQKIQQSLEITKEIVDQTSATGTSDDNDDSDGNGSWTEV